MNDLRLQFFFSQIWLRFVWKDFHSENVSRNVGICWLEFVLRAYWDSFAEGCHTFQWELSSQKINTYHGIDSLLDNQLKNRMLEPSVVYRKLILKKKNIASKCTILNMPFFFLFISKSQKIIKWTWTNRKKMFLAFSIGKLAILSLLLANFGAS